MIEKVSMYYPRALHGDGGVTNSLWLWAESLQRAGVAVEVLYDPRLPISRERSVPAGVRTRPVPHHGWGRLTIPWHLGRELDPSTLLVLHSGYVPFNIVAGEVAKRRGIPYVVVPHGAYDPKRRQVRQEVKTIWESAERRMVEQALAAHVFFEAEVDHVRKLAPATRIITAATAYPISNAEWSVEKASDYVAWLGRYDVLHKGLDRLLDAIATLPPERRPPLRMHGRDHKNARRAVQKMVVERGLSGSVSVGKPIDGAEKYDFMLKASAYIHPARWDSHSVALAESLALGVPTVTTTDISIASELEAAAAALVVEGTTRGLAHGLASITAGVVSSYGPRGREFVRNKLSHEAAGRSFLHGAHSLIKVEAGQ